MSSTEFEYPRIAEDSIEGIRILWEPIAARNSVVAQCLIEAQSQNFGAGEFLARIQRAISFISTGQVDYYNCALPYQLPHKFSHGYVCETDPAHRFCLDHVLTKCVICGGDLRYE